MEIVIPLDYGRVIELHLLLWHKEFVMHLSTVCPSIPLPLQVARGILGDLTMTISIAPGSEIFEVKSPIQYLVYPRGT